jgi:hypothetical protein
MKPGWYFNPFRRGDRVRDPIQGEFFASEAIDGPAEALVREGIQNSLDANPKDATGHPLNKPVRVRIFLSGPEDAVPGARMRSYLEGAWKHLRAPRNGLQEPPEEGASCPFLVFEDFSTTGLTGDPDQWEDRPGVTNPFFYFFRAEGRSPKGEADRGRWGVGKAVFPRASRINSIFGVTVRHDDKRRLLMGNVVLKTHRTASGDQYSPDGWYGVPERSESSDGSRLILPVEDAKLIDTFCTDFRLERGSQSGLSIVVPWYEEEITAERLIRAVIRGYFFPILTEALEVTVATPAGMRVLTADSLLPTLEEIGGETQAEMVPIIGLSRWAMTHRDGMPSTIAPAPTGAPKWSAELLPAEVANQLRSAFNKGEPIAVRVPLPVRRKGGDPKESWFDVFLRRDPEGASDRSTFIREGIIIPDVRAPRVHGIRALVVAEHGPLARLLGDAENPAHTQWQRDGSNFKGKYIYGPSYLTFVTSSVAEIARMLSDTEAPEDRSLLLDIFSLPAEEEDGARKKRKVAIPPVGPPSPPPPPPPSPRLRQFRVTKIQGGFTVTRGEVDIPIPRLLEIHVAYDRRNGNPLKKYNRADFKLDKGPIVLDPPPRGLRILGTDSNRLVVSLFESDFSLAVRGFDENRDLYVRVVPREAIDDQEA